MLLALLACVPASIRLDGDTATLDSAGELDTDTGGQVDSDTNTGEDLDTGGQVDSAGDTAQLDTDTGGQVDTGEDLDTGSGDTATSPPALSLSPAEITLYQDSGTVAELTITGDADPLTITCPDWITVSAPGAVHGSGVAHLSPVHGWAVPIDDTCDVGGTALPVHMR